MKRQLLSRSHLLCILSLLFVSQVHGACTKITDAETREACQNAEQRAADKELANKKVYMAYKQHLQNNSFFTPIKALLPNSSFRPSSLSCTTRQHSSVLETREKDGRISRQRHQHHVNRCLQWLYKTGELDTHQSVSNLPGSWCRTATSASVYALPRYGYTSCCSWP
jgi:hypothetical protein